MCPRQGSGVPYRSWKPRPRRHRRRIRFRFSPGGSSRFEVSSIEVERGTARDRTVGRACPSRSAISSSIRQTTRSWLNGSATHSASKCRTGWGFHVFCAAIRRITGSPLFASRLCLNHVAYGVTWRGWTVRCAASTGSSCLRRYPLGPRSAHGGQQHIAIFYHAGGFAVEYTSELEEVEDATWEAQVHTGPLTTDQWGLVRGGP